MSIIQLSFKLSVIMLTVILAEYHYVDCSLSLVSLCSQLFKGCVIMLTVISAEIHYTDY